MQLPTRHDEKHGIPYTVLHKTHKCSAAYVQIPYTELYTNHILNMESTDKNSYATAPLYMQLVIIPWHYVNIAYTEFNTNRSINMENASRNLFVL